MCSYKGVVCAGTHSLPRGVRRQKSLLDQGFCQIVESGFGGARESAGPRYYKGSRATSRRLYGKHMTAQTTHCNAVGINPTTGAIAVRNPSLYGDCRRHQSGVYCKWAGADLNCGYGHPKAEGYQATPPARTPKEGAVVFKRSGCAPRDQYRVYPSVSSQLCATVIAWFACRGSGPSRTRSSVASASRSASRSAKSR